MTFPLWIQLMQVKSRSHLLLLLLCLSLTSFITNYYSFEKSSDIEPDSPYFRSLMKLYFLYAAHQPSEDDWEILSSSYSTFQWNKTDISMENNISEVYSINSEDIIIDTNDNEINNNGNSN